MSLIDQSSFQEDPIQSKKAFDIDEDYSSSSSPVIQSSSASSSSLESQPDSPLSESAPASPTIREAPIPFSLVSSARPLRYTPLSSDNSSHPDQTIILKRIRSYPELLNPHPEFSMPEGYTSIDQINSMQSQMAEQPQQPLPSTSSQFAPQPTMSNKPANPLNPAVPLLPTPTSVPMTQSSQMPFQTMYPSTFGPAGMPVKGSSKAPRTFKGHYTEIQPFLKHLEHLYVQHGVTTDSQKVDLILDYCNRHVRDFIKTTEGYRNKNWNQLKDKLLNAFDADCNEQNYTINDVIALVSKQRNKPIKKLEKWKKYMLDYETIAGSLYHGNKMSEWNYHGYFWMGIPSDLQTILSPRLLIKYPSHSMNTPYTITQVNTVAEQHFQRDRFHELLPPLTTYDSDSDSDSDSDTDSDDESSDSDDEDERRHCRRQKDKKKKKSKESRKKPKPRQSMDNVPRSEVNSLIESINKLALVSMNNQLNNQVRESPQPDGYVANVSAQPSVTQNYSLPQPIQQYSVPQPQSYAMSQPQNTQPYMQPQTVQTQPYTSVPQSNPSPYATYPNSIPLRSNQVPTNPMQAQYQAPFRCFGCFNTDHFLNDCPRMKELVQQGILDFDQMTRKFCMKQTRLPIMRFRGETLYDAAVRISNTPATTPAIARSNLVTAESDSEDDNASLKQTVAEYYHEVRADNVEFDSDDDDEEPQWRQTLHTRQYYRRADTPEDYYNSDADDSDDEEEGTAFPVARSSKRTTEAREKVNRVPTKPAKQVFDGVYPPQRKARVTRQTRPEASPVVQSNPTETQHNESSRTPTQDTSQNAPIGQTAPSRQIVPATIPEPTMAQQPIDVRKLRPNQDLPIEADLPEPTPAKVARKLPKDAPSHVSSGKDATKGPARQSEVSRQVNTRDVVQEILDTQITLPIQKIIGTSKEIASDLSDVIKLRNKVSTQPMPNRSPVPSSNIDIVPDATTPLNQSRESPPPASGPQPQHPIVQDPPPYDHDDAPMPHRPINPPASTPEPHADIPSPPASPSLDAESPLYVPGTPELGHVNLPSSPAKNPQQDRTSVLMAADDAFRTPNDSTIAGRASLEDGEIREDTPSDLATFITPSVRHLTNKQPLISQWTPIEDPDISSTTTETETLDSQDFENNPLLRPLPQNEPTTIPRSLQTTPPTTGFRQLTLHDVLNPTPTPANSIDSLPRDSASPEPIPCPAAPSPDVPIAFRRLGHYRTNDIPQDALRQNLAPLRSFLGIIGYTQRDETAPSRTGEADDEQESSDSSSDSDSMPGLEPTSDSGSNTADRPRGDRHHAKSPFSYFKLPSLGEAIESFRTTGVNPYIPNFRPPTSTIHRHDEYRWIPEPARYHPLTTSRTMFQRTRYNSLSRAITSLWKRINQFSRMSPSKRTNRRRNHDWTHAIPIRLREELLRDYDSYKTTIGHYSDHRAYDQRNPWLDHLSSLIQIRQLVNTILIHTETFVRSYAYQGGLREYTRFHKIDIRQPPRSDHPLLHPFEIQYLFNLRQFLYDFNCPTEYDRVHDILHKTFPKPQELRTVSHIFLRRLAPPHYHLDLERA
ncbi:hypothetical protein CVT26_010862 [Gymnopilus dilepis]|uniref:CCHC-type domain-containing protein n=1 Tax=Gymnopilus dilepis TaxID=231916 RepID=A0A409WSM4_9AGAR|nr:hypothetical protein CVT26_010862 [Gymnopilus dilepis]